MTGQSLYLALRSLSWFRGRSITIVLCLALTIWLPLTIRLLLNEFRSEITARAEATPLIIGAKGSRIDLVLHALYFETKGAEPTTMAEARYVRETQFAQDIPLHIRHVTQDVEDQPGAPIVGTTIEYFEFRKLRLARGNFLGMLGDCVIGAGVAERMHLEPGDTILSAPTNAFDLAGDYPLQMNITGVLSRSHTPDDDVVFIDVKTAWVIDGIGHGHQAVNKDTDKSLLLESDGDTVTASAAVLPYTQITEDNVGSFHFHGDPDEFPISAVLAVPLDSKSQTLLLGRYASVRDDMAQCVKPIDAVGELLQIVFRIEQLFWVSTVFSFVVTVLLLILVVALSIRLRATEIETMWKLGCSRMAICRLLGTEVGIMLCCSTVLALVAAWGVRLAMFDVLRRAMF